MNNRQFGDAFFLKNAQKVRSIVIYEKKDMTRNIKVETFQICVHFYFLVSGSRDIVNQNQTLVKSCILLSYGISNLRILKIVIFFKLRHG